jgi:hypothetical protein
MAQQTAVEWLVKELKLEGYDYTVEQAKQMEMEQIAETYRVGVEEDIYNNPLRTGKEYYNDIYKK